MRVTAEPLTTEQWAELAGRIWDAATGAPLLQFVAFPDSWANLDGAGNVARIGPNAWKYLHAIARDADGQPRVVRPDLALA
jgi:hypothetical protein